MIREKELAGYPVTRKALGYLNAHYNLFGKTSRYLLENFDGEYLGFCEEILSLFRRLHPGEEDFEKGLQAFIRYSHEYLLLQAELEREGRYHYESFRQVNEAVYQRAAVMNEYYLDGLLLSQLFWPNHYRMGRFLLENRGLLPSDALILDVPSGSGIYAYALARHCAFRRLDSIDISPYACEYTEALLRSASLDSGRITVAQRDIFDFDPGERYDWIVCGELLEHLEDPSRLLDRLHALLREQGHIFLTTAVFAAAVDHLYLFHHVAEVRALLEKRFGIVKERVLPVSLEAYRPGMENVPINYACLLRKKNAETAQN